METTKIPNTAAEYAVTFGLVIALVAVILVWRTLIGADDGVLKLLHRLS